MNSSNHTLLQSPIQQTTKKRKEKKKKFLPYGFKIENNCSPLNPYLIHPHYHCTSPIHPHIQGSLVISEPAF